MNIERMMRTWAVLFAAGMICIAIDCEWLMYVICVGYVVYRAYEAMMKKRKEEVK